MSRNISIPPDSSPQTQPGTSLGFATAAISFAAIYMASSAPVPLFDIYRQTLELGHSDLSWAAVAYFIGAIAALLIFARLSDFLGRRTVIFANLLLAMLGCIIFSDLADLSMLLCGRFIQGFSCGLASSAVAAYVVDNAPKSPAWLAAVTTGAAPMLGLAAGSLASGALRQYGSGSLSLIFIILVALLAVCALLLPFCPRTMPRRKGALRSLKPQIQIPTHIRRFLPAAFATFVGTWSIGGFYLPFSASMAAEQLHTDNTMVAAAIFACMMTPYLAGGPLAGRMKPANAQRAGMTGFATCIIGVVASLMAGSITLFLLATVGAGIAWGVAFTGSLRAILGGISKEERAGVLSTIFLVSYSGAAIPNMIIGRIAGDANLVDIAAGYGLLVFLCWLLTLATAGERRGNLADATAH